MSKIIQIGEHNFELPPLPTKGGNVLFSKDKKANQYWRRQTDFPSYFYDYNPLTILFASHTRYEGNILIALNEDESEELLRLRDQELLRRINGVWFMNNGEPTWLTGGHYFALQWGHIFGYVNPETGTPFGEFRMFHRDYFYFLEHCKKLPNVIGGFIAKPKKTGITQMTALEILDEATRWKEKNFGFMSENFDKCKNTNFKFFRHGYDNLPFIFRPELGKDLQDEMIFSKVRAKQTGTKQSMMKGLLNTEGFNTAIYAKSTVATAFDSDKFFRAVLDEFPKCKDPSPAEIFSKSSQGVKEGISRVIGKMWLFSYFPEDNSKGFLEAQKIYFDSKLKTIKEETGRTKSELLSYFIPVDVSTTGEIDKYGFGDVPKVRKQIFIERKQIENDSKALQAYKRQYPLYEEDALGLGSGTDGTFNNVRLGILLAKLEERDRLSGREYVEGVLRWKGERMRSEVIFVPLTEQQIEDGKKGPFRMYHRQYMNANGYNLFNLPIKEFDGTKLRPSKKAWCAAGIDTTEYLNKKHVAHGSLNASWAWTFPDIAVNTYYGKCVTDIPFFRYFFRHDNPLDTLEDFVLMTLFLGCYVRIEANKAWLITKFEELGLEEFILLVDNANCVVKYNPKEHQKLPTATEPVIKDYCVKLDIWLSAPFDKTSPDMIDFMQDIETVSQLISFKPEDTTAFDLVVALGNAKIAVEGFSAIQKRLAAKGNLYDSTALQSMMRTLVENGI